MIIGPNPALYVQGDDALKRTKAMILAGPHGSWNHLSGAAEWFKNHASGDSSMGTPLPELGSKDLLTLCCASLSQRWTVDVDEDVHYTAPMAHVLAYLRFEQAFAPLTPADLRNKCGEPYPGWCFKPLDASTEQRALYRLRSWANAALQHIGGDDEADESQLASALDFVRSAPTDSKPMRQISYANMIRLGERRLWMRLLEWLNVFDGLFNLVDSPNLVQEYADRVFTSPDLYPTHKYARNVVLPLLETEYAQRQAQREQRSQDL